LWPLVEQCQQFFAIFDPGWEPTELNRCRFPEIVTAAHRAIIRSRGDSPSPPDEIDRSLTVGGVRKAPLKSRPEDEAGIAFIVNGLSQDHRDYLATRGLGFMIGDGRLTYGLETIAEIYC